MLDRIVAFALALVILCFLLVIVWPAFEDDPPTLLQAVYVTSGVIFATLCALFYFSGPS